MKRTGLILILILALSIIPAQAGTSNPIGYEINGDVVTIWNPDTSYYFNKTSGIQWVENPDEYWSRNVFSVGYYSGDEWVQMYSADSLGNFNREINSDHSTFVNATLWRDFTYSGYELRLGVNYYLGVDDTELSVTPFIKNLDYRAFPASLGFSWAVTDIDIPRPFGVDMIHINDTTYPLAGTYDLTFKDMKHITNGSIVYDSNYRIFDYTEYLTLEWDHSLDYQVHLECNGVQDEAVITWLVNAGIFQPGQTKQTTLYWADAEGDYTGVHWNTDGQTNSPSGVTTDGVNTWVIDTVNTFVYRYTLAGAFVSSFTTGGELPGAGMQGITNNGTHLFAVSNTPGVIYIYTMAGGYTGSSLNINAHEGFPQGITTNGTYIWVVGKTDDIHRFWMNGTFIDQFDLTAPNAAGTGITTDSESIWVVDNSDDEVYKYWVNGTFITNWDTSGEAGNAGGLTQFSPLIYVLDLTNEEVYVYEGLPIAPTIDSVDNDAIINRNEASWINVTVVDLLGVANIDYVDLTVNTSGGAENFTFRWTQVNDTFTEREDPDNIVLLNTTDSESNNLDATATIVSFLFTMTGGTSGLADVTIVAFNDAGLSDTRLFPNQFAFALFGWTDVGWLINDAGEFWGISDIMGDLQTLITGLSGDFSVSITNFLGMVRQQLRLVYQIIGWFIAQFTGMVTTVLNVWNALYGILDGTSIVVTGVGNWWTFIALDNWIDGLYLGIFILWIESISKRGRTQGEITVFLADVNQLINISSFFVSISLTVFELVLNKVLTLFDAIMTVVPI